jgi:hypothetical protein
VKSGECPICPAPHEGVGEASSGCLPQRLKLILQALAKFDEGPLKFKNTCRDAGIKAIQHPFWEKLPYLNIYSSITPNILHQLYQGSSSTSSIGSRWHSDMTNLTNVVPVSHLITTSNFSRRGFLAFHAFLVLNMTKYVIFFSGLSLTYNCWIMLILLHLSSVFAVSLTFSTL